MASIELYINRQLCETENPENFSVYLKRQLINPAELSTKDAQRSYDITLPATATNNAIFGYINTEEVKGKFSQLYDAQLLVGGIKIFDGKFKLSEITKEYYKGNLGVPAPKTVKDIFGETKMNQAGKWIIPFNGIQSITDYNTGKHDKSLFGDIPPCIFPLVLYGLLPRDSNKDKSPDRLLLDNDVILTKDDVPPSVNCLQMLKRIFANANYNLGGAAMDDERLKNIFVSYRNASEYEMPWSAPKLSIKGKWTNYVAEERRLDGYPYGKLMINAGLGTTIHNLFNSYTVEIGDSICGDNDIEITKIDEQFHDKTNVKFIIPRSGLYKVEFSASIAMGSGSFRDNNHVLGMDKGSLFGYKYELKLVRNYNTDYDFNNDRFDNVFYKDNFDQIRGQGNADDFLFPQGGNVNFIDPKQNSRFICGFSWGGYDKDAMDIHYNPYNTEGIRSNPMAISGGRSWDIGNVDKRLYSAVRSPGYRNKTGEVSNFKVDIDNVEYPKTDYFPGGSETETDKATGEISQIVWLEKGDTLAILDLSLAFEKKYNSHPIYALPHHYVDFNLAVTPFQQSYDWLTVDKLGFSDPDKQTMNWDAPATFLEDKIDLVRYLPTEVKVNDWIDNFCKAFNLDLIYAGGNDFELKVKTNEIIKNTVNVIDLDKRADIRQSVKESLKLPNAYELGFTVDRGEAGYYDSITEKIKDIWGNPTEEKVITAGDTGGGQFYTRSHETTVVSHTSNFSYNWFKKMKYAEKGTELFLPVISEKDVWNNGYGYFEMWEKRNHSLAQRFWFHSGSFDFDNFEKNKVALATVSEKYEGKRKLVLNYKDQPDSIARSFFLLLTKNDNNYTIVNCYLSPEEYENINNCLVKLNGDLYNIAEVDGYDSLGKKQCTLKLIRIIN